jgi:hypothetical protein
VAEGDAQPREHPSFFGIEVQVRIVRTTVEEGDG